MKRLDELFKEAVDDGIFPGAVLLVGNSKKIIFQKAYGYRSVKPRKEKNDVTTIYDLASMTKVIATTPAIMKVVEEGKISLYDRVRFFVEGFDTQEKQDIRVWHLLTHTSGLPPYSNAWKRKNGRKELLDAINLTKLENPVGKKYVYSCLNFITLMEIVERVISKSFDDFLKEQVFAPLEMKHTSFTPSKKWLPQIAPTSKRNGKILRGEVDDELAYYLGGVSGNAGLFSTAEDIYKYAKMLLNKGKYKGKKIFSEATISAFTAESFSNGTIRRALGWDMKSYASSCGDLMSEKAYGHTGFTGTSIWIDPIYDVVVILLTNRVNISRRKNLEKIIEFRPRLQNYVLSHFKELTE
ncbi:serine hydrolase domain-containing protein [Mesoaciditoga sp.]